MKLRTIGAVLAAGALAGSALAMNTISRHVVASGSGRLSATTHTVTGTVGQATVGLMSAGRHEVHAGFWAGAGGPAVGVTDPAPEPPLVLALGASEPNPVTGPSWIQFDLPCDGHVVIDICSVTGRTVRSVWSGYRSAGRHRIQWDGRDDSGHLLPTGVYLYRLRADDATVARKVVIMH